MDFEDSEGNWTDLNGSYRLPFVVEYDSVAEPATLSTPVDGYRKVLVIPVRFQDEGYTYQGSSAPLWMNSVTSFILSCRRIATNP